jgi:hypothetical protein
MMQTLLLLLIPILIVPAIIARSLLYRENADALTRMAGLLTLKPVFTTPLWWLILYSTTPVTQVATTLSILPGAGLTLLTLYMFRSILFGRGMHRAAWLLIVLDCIRWSNSYIIALSSYDAYQPQRNALVGTLAQFSGIIGLLMPSLFALVAWRMTAKVQPGNQV